MRPWLLPARRATEATQQQIVATGAAAGAWPGDGIDSEPGWRPAGSAGRREPPYPTLEKARTWSVAAYRANPMAKAIIDTYTSFCVGDTGVVPQVTNTAVKQVVDEFWGDPYNNCADGQELGLRSCMLLGEIARRTLVGSLSGVVRYAPMDPNTISRVGLRNHNPSWPERLFFVDDDLNTSLSVIMPDDKTELRTGEAWFWAPFKTLETDVRSMPFLAPVLDHLDDYDQVIRNLIDRTALARYMVWDVTVEGGQAEVDDFVERRGGKHVPPSGSVEVHNQSVTWEAKFAPSGAEEDSTAAKSVLTLVAGGAGLAKTWLAEPEDANRATSLTMAEPVRRRVQGVQKMWLARQAEMCRFSVDRAVAAKRLPPMVEATDPRTGETFQVLAAQSVTVTGPEVAAADAQITAEVLLNLSTGLDKLVQIGALTPDAAAVAARKAWEDYMGVPYSVDLGKPEADPDDIATHVDDKQQKAPLRAVPGRA